jgi:hypothetical protein
MENLDYNHSTWIDLVMQHVAGITPHESDTLTINPVDMGWKSFSLKNIRYRNHDLDIEFSREKGMIIRVDGVVKARTAGLQKVVIKLRLSDSGLMDGCCCAESGVCFMKR